MTDLPNPTDEPTAAIAAADSIVESTQADDSSVASFADVLAEQAATDPIPSETAETGQDRPRWYIVHTYSGFEHRVEATIREMIRNKQDHGLIHEIVVPTEKVVELGKGGTKRTTTRKFYPGYIMLRMTMTDYSWHVVQTIPKVTGFVGGKNRPAPMKDEEAKKILDLMETRQEKPRPKYSFDRGDEVRVIEGPFANFSGVVEVVNQDKNKLTVSVSIFGRQTPVELDFIQVSKN